MEKFNMSPEEAAAAGKALTERSIELIHEAQSGGSSLLNDIWENLGFHEACVRLMQAGASIPTGANAEVFITLVLAAAEAAPTLRAFEWGEDDAQDTAQKLLSEMGWQDQETEEDED